MEEKTVILMLSGGRDSFLSACKLLEAQENYKILMVTYNNGCSVQEGKSKEIADRIISRYGADRAEFLGVYNTIGVIREFFSPYFNMTPAEQEKEFFGMTPSQFHCLICRTSMYIYSIWLAKLYGAKYIAEGGREDQKFVIELPGMAKDRFPALVKQAGLEDLILPVYDMNDDWVRDNELMLRNYSSKSHEPKCLLGFPENGSVNDDVIKGVHAYYDKIILPRINNRNLLSLDYARIALGINCSKYNELTS